MAEPVHTFTVGYPPDFKPVLKRFKQILKKRDENVSAVVRRMIENHVAKVDAQR